MITTHTQLLNALIEKYGLKSYLEIGVQNPANNFNLISCKLKTGVDPECEWTNEINNVTSDEFFERYYSKVNNRTTFDLVFIDGLHHADQVKRDFENSLRCLSDNGFIVIHDVLPDEEQFTQVPRSTKKWFGNVYQFAMTLNQYDGIGFVTFNIDCGCTLVWIIPDKVAPPKITDTFDWPTYTSIGRVLLNVTNNIEI